MKIAIIANNLDSFILPLAQGLQRMFNRLGIEARILYRGLAWLERPGRFQGSGTMKLLNVFAKTQIYRLLFQLRSFDVIVVVLNLPRCFEKRLQIEMIRKVFPDKIIVNYDLHYLLTCGWWERRMKHGDVSHGIVQGEYWGLERYDWYLMVSLSGLKPLPPDPQPVLQIGVNLDDGTLFPAQPDEFIALIDFERPLYMKERMIQIQALEETGTKYFVLNGQYPLHAIRAIYRQCRLYLVASLESFGLPICELQACGAYVVTPYLEWCPGHWIKDDPHAPQAGKLSPNFIMYGNDKARLIEVIRNLKRSHNARTVIENFKQYQPHFLEGDMAALRKFVEMVQQGAIHSQSHKQYSNLTGVVLPCQHCGKELNAFEDIGRFVSDCLCKECNAR